MGFRARWAWVGLVLCWAGAAWAGGAEAPAPQAGTSPATTSAAPEKRACAVQEIAPSAAEKALRQRRFDEAEKGFGDALAADPNSDAAMAGLVRTALAKGGEADALALAIKFDAAHPNRPVLLDAMGEVRFRRGEVEEAAVLFNRSMKLDLCNGVTHYDVGRFLNLSGMYKTAQAQLDLAHTLLPGNAEIEGQWRETHAVPPTPAQRLERLKARLARPGLTDEQKDGIAAAIKGIETQEKGSCELVSPMDEVKLPIVPIADGAVLRPEDMYAAGLEVQFNGKKRRMEIDTGASGLLLSRAVAKSAGLVPELETKAGGIGDAGAAGAFVTHVDDIKIGKMEFRNCMVRVLEQNRLDVDGLIGPDVFRDYLVTLDIPGREVRLARLPPRPNETGARTASLDTSEDADDEAKPLSAADQAKDRYIAPEMKDWTRAFRSGHFLIFPTVIGKAPVKLFMMDTGASQGMITPAAAREVTSVQGGFNTGVRGISGEVNHVLVAEDVSVSFAGVRQLTRGMMAYDSAALSSGVGADISGLIGFPMLRELVISIDYRDNLVRVVYDRNKGFHAH